MIITILFTVVFIILLYTAVIFYDRHEDNIFSIQKKDIKFTISYIIMIIILIIFFVSYNLHYYELKEYRKQENTTFIIKYRVEYYQQK